MINQSTIIDIVRKTRDLTLPQYGIADIAAYKNNDASDVVTEIDRAVELFLKKELNTIHPEIAFVGEEYGGDLASPHFWLCDPIDGTAHYIRGLPFCTTMLALINDGEVIFSVIYDFLNDTAYVAEKGKGAFMHDAHGMITKLHVSNRPFDGSYLGYESNMKIAGAIEKRELVREQTVLVNTINVGWEMIQVASGRLDGRIQYYPYGTAHDFAPGALLVREAGGVVANLGSHAYDFRNYNFMAVTPHVHAALTKGSGAPFPIL